MGNKKGQVTLFIMLAIMIVAAIVLAIYFMGGVDPESQTDLNPKQFIQKCVRNAVEDSVELMLMNGGQRNPSQAITYLGEEWNYLCYQGDFYLPCYNLHPMLENLIESEIEADIDRDIQECFDSMEEDFGDKGYDVSGGKTSYSVDLLPGKVAINLDKKIDLVRGESSQTFRNFDLSVMSPIYELARIAREVVNSESQFCHFEYNGYMLLYPDYEIRRVDYSDSKIYRLIDRTTGAEFKFAVRSCAFAPGI